MAKIPPYSNSTVSCLRYPRCISGPSTIVSLHCSYCSAHIDTSWKMLSELYSSQVPLVTDGRFCSRSLFKSGMWILQQVVSSRRSLPTPSAHCGINQLESFSVDYDCLYAIEKYSPDCYTFLMKCCADGIEGQPPRHSFT